MLRSGKRGLALLAGAVLLAGCTETDPIDSSRRDPEVPIPMESAAALTCSVSVAGRTVTCETPQPKLAAGGSGLIVGGQNTYVRMTADNLAYNDTLFTFDATVTNLIPQPLGTLDGTTPSPDGVRVFFHQAPTVTVGTGTITFPEDRRDSTATFTAADQIYYGYAGMLAPNAESEAKTWTFEVPPTVENFVFTVFVSADVQYPEGWVALSPTKNFLLEGGTHELTSAVFTAVGNPVADAVTYETSDAGVATVDGSGMITAVAPGSVTITATAGTRSGTLSLQVCPDLAVGEAYTATMPGAAALCFAGGASGTAEYTYMPVNLSNSSALSLTVTGTGIQAVTGPPTPDMIGAEAASLMRLQHDMSSTAESSHLVSLERDKAGAANLLRQPASRVQPKQLDGAAAARVITPGVPALDDLMTLNVAQGCSGPVDNRVGRVRSIGQRIIIVSDTANPAGGFTTAQFDSISMEFDSIAWPSVTNAFGTPADVDSNNRIVAFFTRAVNELSPPASSVVNSGYFANRDMFSSDPVSGCERSNAGEILYMLVPDPTGAVNSNVRTVSFVRGNVVRTLGHELTHLVNASRRVYITGATSFEDAWLDEGLAHVAEELKFYRTSVGLAPRGNVQLTSLTTGPSASRRVAAFNTYANPNFTNFRSWLQRPDTTSAVRTISTLASRGALWGFLRYAADRVNGDENTFWSSLVNSNLEGKANLQNAFGANPDLWLRDFITAMYADDAVTGIGSEYNNPSWNFRSVFGGLGGFPLGTRPLTNGVGLTLSYATGANSYIRFSVPTNDFASITALSGGVPPTSPFALTVMRTK